MPFKKLVFLIFFVAAFFVWTNEAHAICGRYGQAPGEIIGPISCRTITGDEINPSNGCPGADFTNPFSPQCCSELSECPNSPPEPTGECGTYRTDAIIPGCYLPGAFQPTSGAILCPGTGDNITCCTTRDSCPVYYGCQSSGGCGIVNPDEFNGILYTSPNCNLACSLTNPPPGGDTLPALDPGCLLHNRLLNFCPLTHTASCGAVILPNENSARQVCCESAEACLRNLQILCANGEIGTAIGCIPTNRIIDQIAFFLKWAVGIAGGLAILLFLYSGYLMKTSTGDPKRLNGGKELFFSALSGLILLVLSVFILRIIGVNVLGIF